MDKKLQTQVLALAMQIIGIKDPSLFKQAMTMMSEQGRTKFLNKCAEIILSGDTSEENIAQAQQEALQAILEGQLGQLAILAKHGNRITYLNRFYSGGAVLTYDGGYMKLKKPLTKDQLEGKLPLGLYKGKWMYLNGDKIAVPNLYGKQKGDDGSTHVNRAYNGMLIPKPNNYVQQYSIGGIFNSIGNWMKGAGSTIKTGLNSAAKWVDKNLNLLKAVGTLMPAVTEFVKGVNTSNVKNPVEAAAHILNSSYLQNLAGNHLLQSMQDMYKYTNEQASKNGSPETQSEELLKLYRALLLDKLSKQLKVPELNFNPTEDLPVQITLLDDNLYNYLIPDKLNLDTSLLYHPLMQSLNDLRLSYNL